MMKFIYNLMHIFLTFYTIFVPIIWFQVSGFGPPWRDMTGSHCSLQEIPILSYHPGSCKVRSGPGVSVKEDTIEYPLMKLRQNGAGF